VPDVLVAPVGDGPTLSALAKAFRELRACGAGDRIPRLIGVQASGSAPLVTAWETGRTPAAVEPSTIADGIAVAEPIGGALALRDVRQSRGALLAATDEAILADMRELASRAGVLAEPAGAAAFAGLRAALEQGVVGRDEETVVLVTGSALKTPQFMGRPDEAPDAVEIQGSLAEVEQVLGGGGLHRR
jgi:threonine synthase